MLVVERTRLMLRWGEERVIYHPGMALHRIRVLRAGGSDPMVEAMGIEGGEQILDATLGPGSDALVSAWATREGGHVVGVEKVAVLGVLTREGLREWPWTRRDLEEAARRIDVRTGDHLPLLREAADGSFDVVYFDAMFERTLSGSSSIGSWREAADPSPVSEEAVRLACRVARRRVVVKDRWDSHRLADLRPSTVAGGRSSRVRYGIWHAGR